jgi:muramoyltetrapeptide carboxypeptidase LdcA involved in peptidoglycan recycling
MIVSTLKPYKEIKSKLKKTDKIGIISCNACARMCGVGGKEVMEKLASKLQKEGFNIVDKDLIGAPCDFDQLNKNQLHGNVQIVLACDAGVYNLKRIFPGHKIISALNTIGLGSFDHKGHINVVKKFK